MNPSNPKRIAFLNTIGENSWGIYTAGFKRSVGILLESVRSTYEVNTVIFPILFLYRHYIELSLKKAIGYGRYLDEQSGPLTGGHNLQNLWEEARKYVEKHLAETIKAKELDKIEILIHEIHLIDPSSEESRYPVVKKKKENVQHIPFPFPPDTPPINLDELSVKTKEIFDFLDKATNYLAVAQDSKAGLWSDYY